ncbi:hypothetical protein AO501_14120 [Mycobacterium gordonae]|uniref:Uncharacterized protein n=1 Tax=Mycobacterium gordonae TaxID=1778 RepID=A0A0Q2XD96_MYCGO|nr:MULTISPECIES: hypothetical protein [Mycobacterium]KQH79204.1 hypothetical protein AO501_14120 [Mycobacterium gordonae]MDP7726999.1 hypothetical protein [Mycobacterium sp. TY813]
MSPATDTAITVAAFVVSAPLVIFFGLPFGVFTAGVAMDQQQARPGRIDTLQRAAALAVPAFFLFGIYLTAVVLATRASGPTFFYPLIAVPLGFAVWYATLVGLSEWAQHTRMAGRSVENPQAGLRRAFAATTIDNAEQAVTAVIEYLGKAGIDHPTTALVAERLGTGWLVHAPAAVDPSPAATPRHAPVDTATFVVGSNGRIQQLASSAPPSAARRGSAEVESELDRENPVRKSGEE